MPKEFVLAIVKANGTRWNVYLSDQRETETFVGRNGAIGFLESSVANRVPVQALIYRPASDILEEAWFFEKGSRRKLNILTVPEKASAR